MTPDETIEQQARREAREAWVNTPLSPRYVAPEDWKHGYAAALIAEMSKPQPSVEEVMREVKPWAERWFGIDPLAETGMATVDLRDRLTKLFNK